MYKKQLALQKLICLLAVIVAAVSFVYALGAITDIYDALYSTMRDPTDVTITAVPGSIIYYDMQPFIKNFVNNSLVLILCGALLFVTNTHSRRKYYIGNYIATGIYSVGAVVLAVWSHIRMEAFKVQFLTTVDFEALKEYAELWETPYLEDTFLLDLHIGVSALLVLCAVLLAGNAVWKFVLMRSESKLIETGKEAAV
jgi:hypothetical protein